MIFDIGVQISNNYCSIIYERANKVGVPDAIHASKNASYGLLRKCGSIVAMYAKAIIDYPVD